MPLVQNLFVRYELETGTQRRTVYSAKTTSKKKENIKTRQNKVKETDNVTPEKKEQQEVNNHVTLSKTMQSALVLTCLR